MTLIFGNVAFLPASFSRSRVLYYYRRVCLVDDLTVDWEAVTDSATTLLTTWTTSASTSATTSTTPRAVHRKLTASVADLSPTRSWPSRSCRKGPSSRSWSSGRTRNSPTLFRLEKQTSSVRSWSSNSMRIAWSGKTVNAIANSCYFLSKWTLQINS